MREIKFRAWDRASKKLEKVNIINWSYPSGLEVNNSNVSLPFTLQQFTGLTDDNGTDIYEGDIAHNIGGDIYEIKFDDGKFVAILDGNVVIDLCELNNDIVIIGNIYENPELLTN